MSQVTEYLNCHRNAVSRWVKNGSLMAFRIGNRDLRFRQEDVDAFLMARSDGPGDRDLGYGRGNVLRFDSSFGRVRSNGPIAKTSEGMVTLTDRMVEVLAAATIMSSASEAAGALGVTEHTVKNHLTNLYARLHVEHREGALIALGWLKVPNEWAPAVTVPPIERVPR